jgi:ABC-type uncharacterized transport system auxiliary subunit
MTDTAATPTLAGKRRNAVVRFLAQFMNIYAGASWSSRNSGLRA